MEEICLLSNCEIMGESKVFTGISKFLFFMQISELFGLLENLFLHLWNCRCLVRRTLKICGFYGLFSWTKLKCLSDLVFSISAKVNQYFNVPQLAWG